MLRYVQKYTETVFVDNDNNNNNNKEGPQQGDPLGPLLFCNTINPFLSSMQSDLTVGFQDDITLGGPVQTVAQDINRIAEQGSRMGLVLNASKCELIADSKLVVADPLLALSLIHI